MLHTFPSWSDVSFPLAQFEIQLITLHSFPFSSSFRLADSQTRTFQPLVLKSEVFDTRCAMLMFFMLPNFFPISHSYYLALTLADAPVLIVFCLIFNLVSYFMTGQPMEQHRIILVISISITLCFTAQVFGLFAGSMFGLTVRNFVDR